MSAQVKTAPTARLVFSEGNYQHALLCYYAAKEWVLDTGMWRRKDLEGLISSPYHSQSPVDEKFVPQELIEEPDWQCRVDIWCSSEAALRWLREQRLPPYSQLEIAE